MSLSDEVALLILIFEPNQIYICGIFDMYIFGIIGPVSGCGSIGPGVPTCPDSPTAGGHR